MPELHLDRLGNLAEIASAMAAWVSLAVALIALWHTLHRSRQVTKLERERRLEIRTNTSVRAPGEASIILDYRASDTHGRYAARLTIIRPKLARILVDQPVLEAEFDDEQAREMDEFARKLGLIKPAAPPPPLRQRKHTDGMHSGRADPQRWSASFDLDGVGPRTTVAVSVVDQATGRSVVRRTVDLAF